MEYITAAAALLFFPLWLGSMLYVAFAEKDAERVEKRELSRDKDTQRVEKQESSGEKDAERVEKQEPSREGQRQVPIERRRGRRRRGRLR